MQICLLNNPVLQASFLRIGIAKGDLVQSGLFSNPSLGLALRFPQDGGLATIEGALIQNIIELWQIPVREQAAERALERAILEVAYSASQLAAETKAAYFAAVAAEQAIEVARDNLRIAEELLALVSDRQEAGVASQVDVNLAQSELVETEVALQDTSLRAFEAKQNLSILLGLATPPDELRLADPIPEPPVWTLEVERLVELAKVERLDLRATRQAVRAAAARIDLEARSVIDVLGVGVDVERDSNDQLGIGPAIELELPIFDQNRAQIAIATFEYREALKLQEALVLFVTQEVHGAHRRAETLWATARFYRERVLPQRQASLELARDAYRLGKTPLLSYLEAQRTVVTSRSEYLERLRASASAIADLERATGQPFSELQNIGREK